jgi:hypothetical protein
VGDLAKEFGSLVVLPFKPPEAIYILTVSPDAVLRLFTWNISYRACTPFLQELVNRGFFVTTSLMDLLCSDMNSFL